MGIKNLEVSCDSIQVKVRIKITVKNILVAVTIRASRPAPWHQTATKLLLRRHLDQQIFVRKKNRSLKNVYCYIQMFLYTEQPQQQIHMESVKLRSFQNKIQWNIALCQILIPALYRYLSHWWKKKKFRYNSSLFLPLWFCVFKCLDVFLHTDIHVVPSHICAWRYWLSLIFKVLSWTHSVKLTTMPATRFPVFAKLMYFWGLKSWWTPTYKFCWAKSRN